MPRFGTSSIASNVQRTIESGEPMYKILKTGVTNAANVTLSLVPNDCEYQILGFEIWADAEINYGPQGTTFTNNNSTSAQEGGNLKANTYKTRNWKSRTLDVKAVGGNAEVRVDVFVDTTAEVA